MSVDVNHFRDLLKTETENLETLCKKWSTLKESDSIPDEAWGQINSVNGQAVLLINQRFKQFRGLVDDCENKTGLKEITTLDLQGFWEMIYFQVEDVHKKFSQLEELKKNDWKEKESELIMKSEKFNGGERKLRKITNKSNMKTTKSSSGLRDHIIKARATVTKSTSASELPVILNCNNNNNNNNGEHDSAFSSLSSNGSLADVEDAERQLKKILHPEEKPFNVLVCLYLLFVAIGSTLAINFYYFHSL